MLPILTLLYVLGALVSCKALQLSIPAVVSQEDVTVHWGDAAEAPSFFTVQAVPADSDDSPDLPLFVSDVARLLQSSGSFTWSPPLVPDGNYSLQAIETVPPFSTLASQTFKVDSNSNPESPPPPSSSPSTISTTPKATSTPIHLTVTTVSRIATTNPSTISESSASSAHSTSSSNQVSTIPSQSKSKPAESSLTLASTTSISRVISVNFFDTKRATSTTSSIVVPSGFDQPAITSLSTSNSASSSPSASVAPVQAAVTSIDVTTLISATFGGVMAMIILLAFALRYYRKRKQRPVSFHRDMMVRRSESPSSGWVIPVAPDYDEKSPELYGDDVESYQLPPIWASPIPSPSPVPLSPLYGQTLAPEQPGRAHSRGSYASSLSHYEETPNYTEHNAYVDIQRSSPLEGNFAYDMRRMY